MTDTTGNASFQFAVSARGGYDGRAGTGAATFEFTVDGVARIFEARGSQEVVLAVGSGATEERSSQMAVLTMGSQPAEFVFNSQEAVLALVQITAKFEYNSAQAVLVTGANEMPDTNSSQIAVLSLVKSNPDRRRMRAWPFWMDGHHFYVLHLGSTGTIVFDTLTRKWSEWKTQNLNNWRANMGINWQEDIVAGGVDNNIIYIVSPTATTDDSLPIVSVITGGYPMRLRESITCDTVIVTSSVGMSGNIVATMGLRTSDDYGLSWQDWGTLSLSDATPRTEVTWQSLGEISAPGRIFEITDSGAAKRINSLDMYSRDV